MLCKMIRSCDHTSFSVRELWRESVIVMTQLDCALASFYAHLSHQDEGCKALCTGHDGCCWAVQPYSAPCRQHAKELLVELRPHGLEGQTAHGRDHLVIAQGWVAVKELSLSGQS